MDTFTWSTAALLIVLVIGSTKLIYNITLHPLRKYPGPRLWAATRVPWCYHQCRGQLPRGLLKLHLRYGHVVRIAPNELSYTHETAWKTIYGQRKHEMSKDTIFRLHTPTGASNILVADRETHSRQRRLLSHAFSESALREQEAILQSYANKLIAQLSTRSGSTVDITAWMTFSTFDLIGHMAFGENFGCLDRGDYAPFVSSISSMAKELTFIQMWKYWGLFALRQLLPFKTVEAGQRKQNIGTAMQTVAKRIQNGSEHRDFLHYILAAAEDDKRAMSCDEIHVNAFSLSIAGSESTATALSGAIFHVLRHENVYRQLVQEVRRTFTDDSEITLASTLDLGFLDAVINETLRVYPPVAITMPRVVPIGGEMIAGDYVPEQTTVGVPFYSMFHHPDHFDRPNDFLPERWIQDNGKDNREVMQPFSFGPRGCLGKNVAKAEMRLLLAKIFYHFDLSLVDAQGDWVEAQKIQGFWQKGPLMCLVQPPRR